MSTKQGNFNGVLFALVEAIPSTGSVDGDCVSTGKRLSRFQAVSDIVVGIEDMAWIIISSNPAPITVKITNVFYFVAARVCAASYSNGSTAIV